MRGLSKTFGTLSCKWSGPSAAGLGFGVLHLAPGISFAAFKAFGRETPLSKGQRRIWEEIRAKAEKGCVYTVQA